MGAYKIASQKPEFMAYLFEQYCNARYFDQATLCAGLGIKQSLLWRLGMSRYPKSVEELMQIAHQFQLDPRPLFEIWNWANPALATDDIVIPELAVTTLEDTLPANLTQPSLDNNNPQGSEISKQTDTDPNQLSISPEETNDLPPLDFEKLVEIFKNPPLPYVRRAAALALGLSGNELAVEPLLEVFNWHDIHSYWAVLEALGKLGSKSRGAVKRISAVIKPLEVISEDLMIKAIQTLGEIGGEEAAGQLIKLLNDKDDFIRFTAIGALGNIDEEHVLNVLLWVAKNDNDIQNRTKAAESITKIRQRMLERVTPENLHSEVDTGPATGKEIW